MISRKKILFVVPGCKHGGTNKSLQNLLEQLQFNSELTINVFALNHDGVYKNIFSNFNLLTENYFVSSLLCTKFTNDSRGFKLFILRNIYRLFKILRINLLDLYYKKAAKNLSNRYDCVIAFQEGETTHFTKHITAQKKIAWVHSDIKSYVMLKNAIVSDELKIYDTFTDIICVSKYTLSSFQSIFPKCKANSNYLYNIVLVDANSLNKNKADETFQIISVGRFDPIKRFGHIPEIALSLKNMDINFCWTIIGGGINSEIEHFTNNVKKLNLENEINYIGEQKNPYPIIKNSDLLVSLSISEACPFVINEALSLQTPVLTTNYPSAYEFVQNNIDGRIVSFDEIKATLSNLITDKDQYQNIKKGAKNFKWDNEQIVRKFNNIICSVN